MAEDLLRRRSALAALYREASHGAAPGLTLAERRPAEMVQVAAWDEAGAAGPFPLPRANRASVDGGVTALWLGPRRFLLVGDDVAARLRGAGVALVDQSHARSVIRLAGPHVRDALAKGTGVDLARFAKNDVAVTLLGHVSVVLHAAEFDTIDVYVPRSYALSLWEWLLEAADEYGYRVARRNDR